MKRHPFAPLEPSILAFLAGLAALVLLWPPWTLGRAFGRFKVQRWEEKP